MQPSTLITPQRRPMRLTLGFLFGVTLTLLVTLAGFWAMMQPPLDEFQAMTIFLGITAAISAFTGLLAYYLGWIQWSPRVSWTLTSSYILSSVLTILNVWWTARLMFLNDHDLTLATILLVFAAGIAVALGYFLSAAVTDKVVAVSAAAEAIAAGDLTTRVEVNGRDEIARLAVSFNLMAAQLQEAERAQRELEQLRRNLIAWIGHDLRTPLASVSAMVAAIADGVVQDEATQQRYLRTAQRNIVALAALIDDLFDMAQMDAGGLRLDMQWNAISDLVSDTLEGFSHPAADKGITLTGMAAPGSDPAYIDARQIGRVLANLVNNALRHTPSGGAINIHAYPIRNAVVVEVSDNGEGIRAEDLPYVFDQFYRGEPSRSRATGGAGLGLAIAKAIVDAHGGRITVESTPGYGTRFAVTLPTQPPAVNPLVRKSVKA